MWPRALTPCVVIMCFFCCVASCSYAANQHPKRHAMEQAKMDTVSPAKRALLDLFLKDAGNNVGLPAGARWHIDPKRPTAQVTRRSSMCFFCTRRWRMLAQLRRGTFADGTILCVCRKKLYSRPCLRATRTATPSTLIFSATGMRTPGQVGCHASPTHGVLTC